jgi:hypothetical protein
MGKMRRTSFFVLFVLAVIALAWFACAQRRGSARTAEEPAAGSAAGEAMGAAAALAEPAAPEPQLARDGPSSEPRVRAAALTPDPPDAPFIGRLIDAETGEPVPWYELELEDEHLQTVRVVSDTEGRFTAGGARTSGPLRLELVDVEGQPPPSSHPGRPVLEPHDGEPRDGSEPLADVRIRIGPTYFVEVALPAPLTPADLRVRLFLDPPEHGAERNNPVRGETLLRPGRGYSPLAPLAPVAWARFSEPSALTRSAWLELATTDGLWAGGARTSPGPGVHREPVRVELRPRCAVRGRFAFTGTPAAETRRSGALALLRVDAEADGPLWSRTEGDGRFRIAGLAPGTYRLEVRDEEVRAEPVTFALRSGERDLGELSWTPIPLAGSVRLRIESALELPIDVQLVRRFDPPCHPPWHSDSWEPAPGGGFASVFEWEELYAGEYDVVVHTHDLGEWHVALGTLEPPVDDLVLRLPAPPPALALEVVDDETGAPLEEWTVLVRGERDWEELDSPRSLPFAVWDADIAFAVCSPGYRARVASPAAAAGHASEVSVDARLARGWSHLFLARQRARGTPLEGVEVRLDGVPAGRTDARGELWVHAAAPAQMLEVAHPTLVWTEQDDDLDGLVTWLALHP